MSTQIIWPFYPPVCIYRTALFSLFSRVCWVKPQGFRDFQPKDIRDQDRGWFPIPSRFMPYHMSTLRVYTQIRFWVHNLTQDIKLFWSRFSRNWHISSLENIPILPRAILDFCKQKLWPLWCSQPTMWYMLVRQSGESCLGNTFSDLNKNMENELTKQWKLKRPPSWRGLILVKCLVLYK